MTKTTVPTLTSRVMLGHARIDITPPVGIFHGLWGAAPPHAASGVHRPLLADVLAFGALDGSAATLLMCFVDHVNLEEPDCERYRLAMSKAAGVPLDAVILTFSHTHAAGFINEGRVEFPGGDKIPAYLEEMGARLSAAAAECAGRLEPATITYAYGQCSMAANRDYWDADGQAHVCGFNPDGAVDQTVLTARATRDDGSPCCTLVNYGCHPTTLAWQNELVSPDYIGATRETVEQFTGAPCVFVQGPCGDQGPRHGFVGDTEVADRNGRSLGFAALSVLETMGPPGRDYHFAGPVVSGATIGTWEYRTQPSQRITETATFAGGPASADLPMLKLAGAATFEEEVRTCLAEQSRAADARDAISARDLGARAERARRWLRRIESLPSDGPYGYGFSVYRMGDAVWIAAGGEPYTELHSALRRRFPQLAVMLCPLSGSHAAGYVLPEDRYGRGLYQEETTVLAPGALETLIGAIEQAVDGLL